MNELKKRLSFSIFRCIIFLTLVALATVAIWKVASNSSAFSDQSFSQGVLLGEYVNKIDTLYINHEISTPEYGDFLELADEFYYDRTSGRLQKWQKSINEILNQESNDLYIPNDMDLYVLGYRIQVTQNMLDNYHIPENTKNELNQLYEQLLESPNTDSAKDYLENLIAVLEVAQTSENPM